MKTELKTTFMQIAFLFALIAVGCVISGCSTPKKVRDIELKGMYVNGYSETLAIGAGRLTSIPGEREALAAHYEEDTAWLSPSTKTHKFDIFLVGTNSVENSKEIIDSICKAFANVAPSVAATNTEAAKASSAPTPLGVIKAGGEVRKTVETAKAEVAKVKAASEASIAAKQAESATASADCPNGECNYELK